EKLGTALQRCVAIFVKHDGYVKLKPPRSSAASMAGLQSVVERQRATATIQNRGNFEAFKGERQFRQTFACPYQKTPSAGFESRMAAYRGCRLRDFRARDARMPS